jgi:hypothetical protein
MPSTRNRVPVHTAGAVQQRIHSQMEANVRRFAGRPQEIERRLRELDREWDIERAIGANASALAFAGIVLSRVADKRFLALSALVTGFLFQHAVQGWCPPVPILRRLGFRTSYEIEEERQALKALRGDFADLAPARRTPRAKKQVQRRVGKAKAAVRAVRA